MVVWILIAVLIVIAVFLLVGAEPWNRYFSRRHMAGRPRLNRSGFALRFYPENPEIAAVIRDILQAYIPVDLSRMQPSDQPVRDFYLGAIYGEEPGYVIGEIESCFNIRIENDAAEKMRTVDDIIQHVISKVEANQ